MKKKIYIVGGMAYYDYVNWILPLGFEVTKNLEEASLVWANGGEDWHWKWYHKSKNPPHPYVSFNLFRDNEEMPIFKKAIELGIPIGATCRGCQILPVLAGEGGKIVQHQTGQSSYHKFKTYDGLELMCTSSHHEAMWPFDLKEGEDYKLLGWTENTLKSRYLDQVTQELTKPEAEVVFFPKIKALGYQMHFEWDLGNKEGIKWAQDTLQKFLKV